MDCGFTASLIPAPAFLITMVYLRTEALYSAVLGVCTTNAVAALAALNCLRSLLASSHPALSLHLHLPRSRTIHNVGMSGRDELFMDPGCPMGEILC